MSIACKTGDGADFGFCSAWRVVALGVNFRRGDYDFGRTRATTFMVTIGF